MFLSPTLSRVSWHSHPRQGHSCQWHPSLCQLSRGLCQAGLTLGVCVGMAQAKQTQWDMVAFGHSDPLKTPRFPRQEGAAAPLSPPPGPRLAQQGHIPPAVGSRTPPASPCPKPQLSSGKIKQKYSNGPFAPPALRAGALHTHSWGHILEICPLPRAALHCPAAPKENLEHAHAQPNCSDNPWLPLYHRVPAVPPSQPSNISPGAPQWGRGGVRIWSELCFRPGDTGPG